MKDKLKLILTKQTEKKPKSLKSELTGILGIGSAKADELIELGLKNISQLTQKKYNDRLSDAVKIQLMFKPQSISHSRIAQMEPRFHYKSVEVILAGSYRRNAPMSRDIDIMIIGKISLSDYVSHLVKEFDGVVYGLGENRASVILNSDNVKADVFLTPPSDRIAMLTYLTGPKQFNIRMRAKAKRMGYLLNQTGLYADCVKIPIRTEKSLFKKLNMEWIEPENR